MLLILASNLAVLPAQQAAKPLTSLTNRFEKAYSLTGADLEKLNTSFAAALKRSFDQQTKAGDLDGAVEVKKEIDAFGNGDAFTHDRFATRVSELVPLERLRETYVSQRQRLEVERVKKVQPLLKIYREQLEALEADLTRTGAVELALKARGTREALDKDGRFSGDGIEDVGSKPFRGRLIFAGKGEFEVRVNSERVSYRNDAARETHYVEFDASPRSFKLGDVISVRMRSPFVYRSFVLAIESEDGTLGAPFRRQDYRIVGDQVNLKEMKADEVVKLPAAAAAGRPDTQQNPAWHARDINPVTLARAQWVQIGTGDAWATCAVVLSKEMMVKLKQEKK